MKIKVFYDKDLNWLKIPVTLKTEHKRIPAFIVFDTGSPNVLINYSDSRRLNLPFTECVGSAGIGGNKYKSYSSNKLEILFKTQEGILVIEKMPVKILKPAFNMDELEELDGFSNILGLDFLKKGWKFFCNLDNDEIYFEKE